MGAALETLRERVHAQSLGLSLVFLAILASPAHAAGELPTLAADIGASLLGAGAIAIVFARLGIPSIAAFILAGVALGPLGLQAINDAGNIEAIAQIGFILLLFVIGLEIDVPRILASGRTLLLAGILQFPMTMLFGIGVTKLMIWAGLGGILTEAPLSPLYIGVAVSLSSSLLVVKLFQEHFLLDTRPGQISLIVLIFQDIWAIIFTLIQPSMSEPDIMKILSSFLGIGLLIAIAVILSRLVANRAFGWIAKKPELVLLAAMAWCFAIMAVGASFDRATAALGLDLSLAVGSGMAALIAGATIASSPFNIEIITKVGLVKDFFVTLFFVGLGMSIPVLTSWEVPILAVLLALLALLARQLVFFPVFYLVGIDQRNAQVSSTKLAQMSEFTLVIVFIGLDLGHVSEEFAAIVILAFVLTAILTTPVFENAYAMYGKLKGTLARIGFKEPTTDEARDGHEIVVAILGVHRDASSFLAELHRHQPDILAHTTVVDFNVALHPEMKRMGVHVVYGDISNEETLLHAGIDRAKVVVCPVSDDLLRGIDTADLVRMVRRVNPEGKIIANAIHVSAVEAIKTAGADVVYMPRMEAAKAILDAVEHAYDAKDLEYFNKLQHDKFGELDERREVLD